MNTVFKNTSEEWQEASIILNKSLSTHGIEASPLVLHKIFSNINLQKRLKKEVQSADSLHLFIEEIKRSFQEEDNFSFKKEQPSPEVIREGLQAFWYWMADGFNIVSPQRFKKRLNICCLCPFYQASTNQVLYKVVQKIAGASPICTKCGCMLYKKAKLASSTCPIENPNQSGYTLWGDLLDNKQRR